MNRSHPAIEIDHPAYAYGCAEAVRGLSLNVYSGRCHGLLGRNRAGKTTTVKCLLNLLRPQHGQVRVFGLDPIKHEVEVKRSLSYVPDQVAFYLRVRVRKTLDYLAPFQTHWNLPPVSIVEMTSMGRPGVITRPPSIWRTAPTSPSPMSPRRTVPGHSGGVLCVSAGPPAVP